jgi:hypothetical protein
MHSILSYRRSQPRRVAWLAMLLLCATIGFTTACGGDSATGPKANPDAGRYTLKQIDGASLPVEVYHGPYFDSAKPHFYNQMVVKAIKGAFELNPDGTYTLGVAFATVGDGENEGFSFVGVIEDGMITVTFRSPLPEDKRVKEYAFIR